MRSLFGKVLCGYIAVMLLASAVMSGFMFLFLGNYVTREKKQNIVREAERICYFTEELLSNQYIISENEYQRFLDWSSNSLNAEIFLFDPNKSNKEPIKSSYVEKHRKIHWEKLDENIFTEIRNGNEVTKVGTLNGVFEKENLTVIFPIKTEDSVKLALAITVPVPEIRRIRTDIMIVFLISTLIALILATIFAYIVSVRISKPIKEMSKAAKRISEGDFNKKIPQSSCTEIAQLSQSFNQMTESLKQLENMRSGFISAVSHELRTPITIITGFVEGILDDTIPPDQQEKYLNIALTESRRMSRIVETLLGMARLDSGGLKVNKTEFDINRMVREIAIGYESVITNKNISVNVNLESEKCMVYADSDLIHRVIVNLIDNAIKYTPENGKIEIAIKNISQKIHVSVYNTGVGIKEEDKNRIFDRFYKVDSSRGEDKKGLGIGLYMVKAIVKAHDNDIMVISEYGKYAKFVFTLDQK